MRNILFRGKSIDSEEWQIGNLMQNPYTEETLILRGADFYIVNPDTVGQFTGLNDKFNIPIYEGDIVAEYDPDTGLYNKKHGAPVVYHEASFCLKYTTSCSPVYHPLKREDCEYLVVIGNVHDNPEMVEGDGHR